MVLEGEAGCEIDRPGGKLNTARANRDYSNLQQECKLGDASAIRDKFARDQLAKWQQVQAAMDGLLGASQPNMDPESIIDPLFSLGMALRAVDVYPARDEMPTPPYGLAMLSALQTAIRGKALPGTEETARSCIKAIQNDHRSGGLDAFLAYVDGFVSKKIEGHLPKPKPETVAGMENTSEAASPKAKLDKLSPSRLLAFSQYQDTIRRSSETDRELGDSATDKEVYAYYKEHVKQAGEELPNLKTWCRYVREARNAAGKNKNTPRAGREHGSSIAKKKDI